MIKSCVLCCSCSGCSTVRWRRGLKTSGECWGSSWYVCPPPLTTRRKSSGKGNSGHYHSCFDMIIVQIYWTLSFLLWYEKKEHQTLLFLLWHHKHTKTSDIIILAVLTWYTQLNIICHTWHIQRTLLNLILSIEIFSHQKIIKGEITSLWENY